MSGNDFVQAAAALHRAGVDDALCASFLSVLPVSAVAVSTLGAPIGSETVCASDTTAARLAEVQLDLGEGPSWEALTTRRPVLVPDLRSASAEQWPLAAAAMRGIHSGAVFAFPMTLGGLGIGAVDLYDDRPVALQPEVVRQAEVLAHGAARSVLRRALARAAADGDEDPTGGTHSRRAVHQASGMVAAQTGVAAEDALLLLRAHAFAAGRTVMDLASAVLDRTIDFTGTSGTDRDDPAA